MKTGEKVLLGAIITIPVSFFGYSLLAKSKGDVAGYLSGLWFYWQEGMTNWERLTAGSRLTANIPTYVTANGINKSETARKIHIDLVLSGDAIEDTKLPAYLNQDKKADPNDGWSVGFGPVTLEAGSYRLDATLKINDTKVDTDSIEFSVG